MKIIKRDGSEATFYKSNIINAISNANMKVALEKRFTNDEIKNIANEIDAAVRESKSNISTTDIQDMVERAISKNYDVLKEYMEFRYDKELSQRKNTTDASILSLLNNSNAVLKEENANKNPTIVSTMRDYMAGEVSKDLSKRYLIPSDIWKAHEDGIIHFHDTDYFSMPIHNCFTGSTKFITDKGIRQFLDFKDGDVVTVKDKDGILREATVRQYGIQDMNVVTLRTNNMERQIKVTPNHRWILKDGTVTTNLKIGDILYQTVDSTSYEIKTKRDAEIFALGFILGDGVDCINDATKVRLCGAKLQYKYIFDKAGYNTHKIKNSSDVEMYKRFAVKQNFVNSKAWRFLSAAEQALLFKGYYAADGRTKANSIVTYDNRMESFIEECSGLAGYYITSRKEYTVNTQYKQNAHYVVYYFMTKQPINQAWKVKSIEKYRKSNCQAWCIEEPITHSFMLEGGIVTGNCDLINLEDMFQNGTAISGVKIDTPRSFTTACTLASQLVAQCCSSQFGGMTISLTHLAPFVEVSRKKFTEQFKEDLPEINENTLKALVEKRVRREISSGIQTLNYQLITLQTTNGQAPFISVNMYLGETDDEQTKADLALIIEESLKQRILGVKNERGEYISPAFPKLLYVLEEDNIHKNSKYWYLTELAAECTAKRMVPDYISEKKMKELKVDKKGNGNCYPCMGCRSFLTPYIDPKSKKPKYYGRFNQGVVTLNLVDVACSSKKDMEHFWYILNDRLELCHRALRVRHEHLRGVKSDVAPILWQHGALARLKPGETIDNLLYNGYSTLSLGYAGLYECVKYMTGKSHTDEESGAKDFALKIMKALNEACAKWKQVEKIDYSPYGTPMESTTYKFAKCLQKRFGKIKDVTDHDYITNSYHINVRQNIDAFKKLEFEAEFQALSGGGAISYCECPNLNFNREAVLELIKFIYDTIMYAELNTKLDWCDDCGYIGELEASFDEDGKAIWKCPNCGSTNQDKLHPIRRVCGYISSTSFNYGRKTEIMDRVLHI